MMSVFLIRIVEREGGFIQCVSKYVSSWVEKRAVLQWKGYQKMSFILLFGTTGGFSKEHLRRGNKRADVRTVHWL